MVTETSEVLFTIVAASVLLLLAVSILLALLLAGRNRRLRHQQQLTEVRARYDEELLRAQLEIQEGTLRTISEEIHDNIGQTLSLAKLHLNTIPPTEEGSEKIASSRDLVGKAIQDLRSLSKTLNRDTVLSAGLVKALEFELGQLQKSGAYTTDLQVSGGVRRLEGQAELILFRIVQEAIQNILKHAEATRVEVALRFGPTTFGLTIRDNGKGLVVQEGRGMEEGSGLKNMRHRAALIGADLQLQPAEGGGTVLTIESGQL